MTSSFREEKRFVHSFQELDSAAVKAGLGVELTLWFSVGSSGWQGGWLAGWLAAGVGEWVGESASTSESVCSESLLTSLPGLS